MRLIDADRLFSERPEFRNPIHEENGEFNKGWNACIDTFCDIIKEQPIAYDVDKVLEEFTDNVIDKTGIDYEMDISLDDAIDIVRRGGIDEEI